MKEIVNLMPEITACISAVWPGVEEDYQQKKYNLAAKKQNHALISEAEDIKLLSDIAEDVSVVPEEKLPQIACRAKKNSR